MKAFRGFLRWVTFFLLGWNLKKKIRENTESRTRTQCFDDFFQGNSKKLKQKWKRSGASWCGLHPSSWLNFEKKIVKILNLELDLVCFDNVFLLICENHNFKDLWSPNNYWHITHWKVQKVWKTIFIYFFIFSTIYLHLHSFSARPLWLDPWWFRWWLTFETASRSCLIWGRWGWPAKNNFWKIIKNELTFLFKKKCFKKKIGKNRKKIRSKTEFCKKNQLKFCWGKKVCK